MKRIIRFSRFFVPSFILSGVLIIIGLVAYFTMGFNLGVDFQAGINQTVQLAYPVATVSYDGKGNAELRVSDTALTLVFSGAEVEQKTVLLDYAAYPTAGDLAKALTAQASVQVSLEAGQESSASSLLVPTYQGNTLISEKPMTLHRAPAGDAELFASIDDVRQSITGLGEISVQTVKPASNQRYLIRVQDNGEDPNFTATARAQILAGLEAKYGANKVVELKTDFVGARFSETLSRTALLLVLATLSLILIYSTIRFKIEYAIAAVLAIAHDALIMVGFIVVTRMEFNSATIAAILTILGYSINDTIVQFDRVREERKLRPGDKFVDVINTALTVTLGRTVITTSSTMLTVLALFFFTTGSMKDFALALFVGMISGTYSTLFIASGFLDWWHRRAEHKVAGRA
ncbi:MAG: protein translocase subunit SecF [Spirochaetae bacterium HGW-Spirochaetae-9]|nr:MAG: protein translocase subunit SecF [Spirochaetae bacterium HGW-Spirochaetae-9]